MADQSEAADLMALIEEVTGRPTVARAFSERDTYSGFTREEALAACDLTVSSGMRRQDDWQAALDAVRGFVSSAERLPTGTARHLPQCPRAGDNGGRNQKRFLLAV
jgi:hypothetical protein